ncbi:thioredoxin-disulfide reductase [Clostridioides difficile]|uniref:thioredoxin-disulfide reductase n=1 Tax=Clostridioides difficile TaxID=1496 RepID=UPI00093F3C95|nr:thioredoxin-disulfide reductase [Clostridioides difficile]EGT3800645.1 thioredoxin-disulfide reductase [Clostridioides difficile]EGT4002814.1 thioredoxin-disulfide reductase [Clostridioides difficile]MBH6908504.1 thioredoxin-disulfide reductase [Clostridioides difficile]MBH7981131.1 thioredoxin-disulfide reductase [Clostridioides difficile]MBH8030519.1 thioredoxin-disulfide reductase [Clostridioides difficile]
MENVYDLVIIGSGPAGLAAGLYGARAKLKTLILEKDKTGGQIVITHEIANYPGSVPNATGPSLIARMVEQCKEFGAEMLRDNIVDTELDGDIKVLKGEKSEYRAKAVIIGTGATPRKIGCPGEKELTGKGVSYCATCDADFFEDFEVFVVGGGDSALEEAMYLTKFARKVTIVHRRQGFRCAKSVEEKAKANPKIEFLLDTVIEEIKGDGILESVVFKNKVTGETHEYFADEEDGTMGVFVFVGLDAQTDLFKGKVDMDEKGYIITDEDMRTNIPGVFAAGDCRSKTLRQVVTATNDGAIASIVAEKYIDEKFGN